VSDLPRKVAIVEEGVREGCQIQDPPLPTDRKLELIAALAATGLPKIQVASMVNPQRVPGWADADEVLERLSPPPKGVEYAAVWLNDKGFERAWKHRDKLVFRGAIGMCASEAFLKRNQNRTLSENMEDQRQRAASYREKGIKVEAVGVMAAFGCNFEGEISPARVVEVISSAMDMAKDAGEKIRSILLADTMAWGTPGSVKSLVGAVREKWSDCEISLHLHDTRGMGIANAYAGLEMGVAAFDASVAGLGGCPFAGHKGAAGNVCTEDLVFMCHEMGIETGVNLEKLIETARLAEEIFGRTLPGCVMKGGTLDKYRIKRDNA
jgi:hydroxymethylglutaryl-CoA lyase